MRVAFLIRSLGRGGSERQLVELAKGLSARGHDISVLVFYGGGVLEKELAGSGIPIIYLDKKHRWDIVGFFIRLIKGVKKEKPEILHSYLATENILAVLLKIFFPSLRIVWGIRSAGMDLSAYDRLTRFIDGLEVKLSQYADLIICNSRRGLEYKVSGGFPYKKVCVVHNGIDIWRFTPNPEAGQNFRQQLNINDDWILVGIVARLDPMKDHTTFFQAAQLILRERRDVRFILIGDDPVGMKKGLNTLTDTLGISDRVAWVGGLENIEVAYSALDILVSSSYSEGFSNVIAEAMACGTPCVVTDVGDSRLIVGGVGAVVPPRNPQALAEACLTMMESISRKEHSLTPGACRERIEHYYSLESMVGNTEQVLMRLLV